MALNIFNNKKHYQELQRATANKYEAGCCGCCVRFTDCMLEGPRPAYSRASIYNGLPVALVDTMHGVMDNRLSSSTPHRVDPRLHALAGQVGGHVLVAMCRL